MAPRHGHETRARILARATLLFRQHGYCATTMRDIARELGITDAALYYYFSGKTEILREVLSGSAPSCPCERDALRDRR